MRKLKLFSLIAVTALTLAIATGCSNGGAENKADQTTETTSNETEQSNETSETNGASQSEKDMFQTLDTTDMKGEKVTKDIFKEKKLTLVNIWATWCSPCVEEIPVLDELAKEYKDGEVGIKGLLVEIDVEKGMAGVGLTDNERKTAEDLLKKTGATYQQLLVSEAMQAGLSTVTAFPTTYFVDENGKMVGEPILGANTKDGWKAEIEKRLKMVEEK